MSLIRLKYLPLYALILLFAAASTPVEVFHLILPEDQRWTLAETGNPGEEKKEENKAEEEELFLSRVQPFNHILFLAGTQSVTNDPGPENIHLPVPSPPPEFV